MNEALIDMNGVEFNPEIHMVKKDGTPFKAFGKFFKEKKGTNKNVNKPEIEVVGELVNPETTFEKVREDVIAGTESEEQLKAKIEREVKEKLMREELERRLRHEAMIKENELKQLNKYNITYDLVAFKNWAEKYAAQANCRFMIDTQSDGSIGAGFHLFGFGKDVWQTFAAPEDDVRRAVINFCKMPVSAGMKKQEVRGLSGEIVSMGVDYNGSFANLVDNKVYTVEDIVS